MAGTAITIKQNDKQVRDLLGRIQKRFGDLTPVMKIIGDTIRTSVIRNFEKGGRPEKWQELSDVTKARRKGNKILMRQGFAGGLAGSINVRAGRDQVSVGTNKVYAAVHQFGAKKGSFGTVTATIQAHLRKGVQVKEHTRKMNLPWGDIPARPFLMVHDKDWTEIRAALNDYLTGGTIR